MQICYKKRKHQGGEGSNKNLTPCVPGPNLFQQRTLQAELTKIKHLVSAPADVYQQLYLATLYHVAEFCQAMPFAKIDYAHPYGLMERQLKITVAALQLRRGLLLPKNASAETIAVEEARWTYALFAASLLCDIHHIQADREVMLHHENGEPIGPWIPLAGSLYEKNTYYSMTFAENRAAVNSDVFMAAVSGRIIPTEAFRWLKENADLFKQWWKAILHESSAGSTLIEIIQKAAKKSGVHLFREVLDDSK